MYIDFVINTLSFKQITFRSRYAMVTLFNWADVKVEVANFCAAMDTSIDQDGGLPVNCSLNLNWNDLGHVAGSKVEYVRLKRENLSQT